MSYVMTGGDGFAGFAFFFLSVLDAVFFAAGFLVAFFSAAGFFGGSRLADGLSAGVLLSGFGPDKALGVVGRPVSSPKDFTALDCSGDRTEGILIAEDAASNSSNGYRLGG